MQMTDMETTMSRRQKDIVHAALTLIGEEGLGRLTIRNVAKRVGFTEPAVYRHFPNKAVLLEMMLEYVSETMRVHFADARRQAGSGREVLEHFLIGMFEKFAEMPALVPLLFTDELLHQEPKLEARITSTVETQIGRIADLVREMQQAGEWRHDIAAGDLATMILGTIRLSVVRHSGGGEPAEHARHVSGVLSALLTGVEPASGARAP